jgi:hypothetical protein
MGHSRDPAAQERLVPAEGGGSHGARVRLWKGALQRLADQTGRRISVCHFPPGTRQGNPIEHRRFSNFSLISGKPLLPFYQRWIYSRP